MRYIQQLRLYDSTWSVCGTYDFENEEGLLHSPVFSSETALDYLSDGQLLRLDLTRGVTAWFPVTNGQRLYPGGLLLCTDGTYLTVTAPDAEPTPTALPFTASGESAEVYVSGDTLFYYRGSALYCYHADTETSDCIVDLTASGFAGVWAYDLFVLDEEVVLLQCADSGDGITLYRMAGRDTAQRIPIRVVCGGGEIEEAAAAEFNRTQGEYRVELERYDSYEAASGILDELDAEILSGEAADVFILPSTELERMNRYADMGLFCDWYSLFSDDSVLSYDNLFPAVRSFFARGDQLFVLSPYLQLQTMIAKSTTADALSSNTAAARSALAEDRGARLTERCERDWAVPYLLAAAQADTVNTETGECRFTSDAFLSLLDWVQTLDPLDRGISTAVDTAAYRAGDILFYPDTVSRISQCLYYRHLFGTEEISFVGYPHETGCGTVMEPMGGLYAISAKTDARVRDAAAAFVQLCFSLYEKNNAEGAIPTTQSGFASAVEQASRRYYAYFYTSCESRSSIEPITVDTGVGAVYRMTAEDANVLSAFLTDAEPCVPLDTVVTSIAAEELSYLIGGVRDSRACAEILQRRLSMYYSERQ